MTLLTIWKLGTKVALFFLGEGISKPSQGFKKQCKGIYPEQLCMQKVNALTTCYLRRLWFRLFSWKNPEPMKSILFINQCQIWQSCDSVSAWRFFCALNAYIIYVNWNIQSGIRKDKSFLENLRCLRWNSFTDHISCYTQRRWKIIWALLVSFWTTSF